MVGTVEFKKGKRFGPKKRKLKKVGALTYII